MTRPSAFLLALIVAGSAVSQNPFEPEIRAYEKADLANAPRAGGVLFVGSSSILRWRTVARDFPEYNVINRGFGGSTIADSIYFENRIVTPYAPRVIVMSSGTNDIAGGKSAEVVARDFQRFVETVRTKLPQVRIIYLSITPAPSRWNFLDTVRRANAAIADYCRSHENLTCIDVFDAFIDHGKPRPELFVADRLHLNDDGYAIWIAALRPVLATMMVGRDQ